MFFLLYVTIGLLAKFLAGLLGIGRGTILFPGLFAIFSNANIPNYLQMHMATSTALTSIIFTSLIAVYDKQRSFSINWLLFRQLVPGMIVGILTGALLALLLSTQILKLLFSLFLFSVAFKLYFHYSPTIKKEIIILNSLKMWSIGFLLELFQDC